MSKRHGRNQKRKSKAENLILEGKIYQLQKQLQIKNKAEYKAAMIVDIAREINPDAPMFENRTVDYHIWRHSPRRSIADWSVAQMNSPARLEAISYIDLNQLQITLSGGEFGEYVSFRVSAHNPHKGQRVLAEYRVSDMALRMDKNLMWLQDTISEALAIEFKRGLKGL